MRMLMLKYELGKKPVLNLPAVQPHSPASAFAFLFDPSHPLRHRLTCIATLHALRWEHQLSRVSCGGAPPPYDDISGCLIEEEEPAVCRRGWGGVCTTSTPSSGRHHAGRRGQHHTADRDRCHTVLTIWSSHDLSELEGTTLLKLYLKEVVGGEGLDLTSAEEPWSAPRVPGRVYKG
jgi:hypothetical protein